MPYTLFMSASYPQDMNMHPRLMLTQTMRDRDIIPDIGAVSDW